MVVSKQNDFVYVTLAGVLKKHLVIAYALHRPRKVSHGLVYKLDEFLLVQLLICESVINFLGSHTCKWINSERRLLVNVDGRSAVGVGIAADVLKVSSVEVRWCA